MELFSMCLPLILTAVSGSLMYFFDRVILARYSIDAMNAAASARLYKSPYLQLPLFQKYLWANIMELSAIVTLAHLSGRCSIFR